MAHAEGQTRQAGQTPTTDGSPAREAGELLQFFCHLSPVVDGIVVHFVEELHLVANKGSWRLHMVCQRYCASTDLAGYFCCVGVRTRDRAWGLSRDGLG